MKKTGKVPYIKAIALGLSVIAVLSCEDFVQVGLPKTVVARETVFTDAATATAAISKVYGEMLREGFASEGRTDGINFVGGFCADELNFISTSPNTQHYNQFYNNSISPNNLSVSSLWGHGYYFIYLANAIIEGLEDSKGISPSLITQLKGEAKFIRAFSHFYLVNLFGDIPYITTTDYEINSVVSRSPIEEVYLKIIQDLKEAQNELQEDYLSSERIRPNKWAATAMLARVYLYRKDWLNAEIESTNIIENSSIYNLVDIQGVFLQNSMEAIWQLKPDGYNTLQGNGFVPIGIPFLFNILKFSSLSEGLLRSFEENDARMTNWINSITVNGVTHYYPFKYKVRFSSEPPAQEYSIVLRLGEQYLIRAEARAMQNQLPAAISDLDSIRSRAELPLIVNTNPSIIKEDLLLAIEQERRIELFTEYGHRWFDLKRTNRATAILSLVKPEWKSSDTLFPIPESELLSNKNLKQNSGY
jgi:hypothetical protein